MGIKRFREIVGDLEDTLWFGRAYANTEMWMRLPTVV
jgi:hypothetical protein